MKRLRGLIAGLIIVVLIVSCSSVTDRVPTGYTKEVARAVSEVASVVAFQDTPVLVRFADAVDPVKRRAAGTDVVSVSPGFRFDVDWPDSRTLSIIPRSPLEPGRTYTTTVDLQRIVDVFSAESDGVVPRESVFSFNFRAMGNAIADETLSLDPVGTGFALRGSIDFTHALEDRDIAEAFSLKAGSARVDLDTTIDEVDPKRVWLSSEVIARKRSERTVELDISHKRLGLEPEFRMTFVVPAEGSFSAVAVNSLQNGNGYRVELSDAIDQSQELAGLLTTEPDVGAGLRVEGRNVLLLGSFAPGEQYSILVSAQIRSEDGRPGTEDRRFDIVAPDLDPAIEYLSSGVFMPSANRRTLGFRTRNLRSVQLQVQRVFENNIGQFLQTESMSAGKNRTQYFNYTYMNRVGVDVVNERIEIDAGKNEWIVSGIDLGDIFDGQPKGLYVISLRYDQEDVVAHGEDYYYRYWDSAVYKPVVETDIGITYKRSADQHMVFAANLVDARPMPGVEVSLFTYQNQVVAIGETDEGGFATFDEVKDEVFFVVAEDSSQRAAVKLNEMNWNVSSFETGGVAMEESGTQCFLYTERGVYRPGDTIHLSAILRNRDGTFPVGHPVSVNWYNPRGQLADVYQSSEGVDGFYGFLLDTDESDPTGAWRAELKAADATFSHGVPVETIVPYRLKVHIEPEVEKLSADDTELAYSIASEYLFGAPAAGLQAESTIALDHVSRRFQGYPGYLFDNEAVRFTRVREQVYYGALDEDGNGQVSWRVPSLSGAPSALQAAIQVRVFEKGGRPNAKTIRLPVEPHDRYVGLMKPDLPYGYVRMGNEVSVNLVVVDTAGVAIPDLDITYRVYRNERYWWWEYDTREDFRLHYKSDVSTELVETGRVVSADTPVSFEFTPEVWGEYFVEVSDAGPGHRPVRVSGIGGHTAGFFFRASWWGAAPAGSDDASLLALRTDKEAYTVGETAKVTFPSPGEGTLVVTTENRDGILDKKTIELTGASDEATIEVPLESYMTPNVYVALSLIQPHAQSINDRPIRLFGVVPVMVEDPSTHRSITINTDDVIAPNGSFDVHVTTGGDGPAQFTLAVVDEGLLDITGFSTPDPWESFYAKQRLSVSSYDTYGHVLGANTGDFFRVYSVGGGYDQQSYTGAEDAGEKRFQQVSLHVGPMFTDESGRSTVTFHMPNYMGSVRIMAVAATGTSYGSSEKTVPVRDDLLILPSYPRVLGPDETFYIPVTVFNLSEDIESARVSIDVEGPGFIEGETMQSISFNGTGEHDITFVGHTREEVGSLTIVTRAVSIGAHATNETTIDVRASSPRVSSRRQRIVNRGQSIELEVPDDGLTGTNTAVIHVASRPDLDIDHRLRWLIRYPYGCIEQTTSAVFPQLYLSGIVGSTDLEPGNVHTGGSDIDDVDTNINAAIDRLRKFQLPSGAFSFWPGSDGVSVWGTNYAGHFLIEAKNLGYHVPDDMFTGWVRYQTSRATSSADGLMERVYRTYLLALADSPSQAAMNVLYETNLHEMTDTMKWLLAEAYQLRGMEQTARSIIAGAGFIADEYDDFGSTFGSSLRDKAMMLEALVLFERWSQAQELFREIALELSSRSWFSTQSTGYSLLAIGKFLQANTGSTEKPTLAGVVQLPDGTSRAFDTLDQKISVPVTDGFGGMVSVRLDPKAEYLRAFVTLEWSGIPLRSESMAVAENLSAQIDFYDDSGRPIVATDVRQGTSFWGVIRASKSVASKISQLALVSIMPSGWEIENLRLAGEDLPDFLIGRMVNESDYTDIRDDRIMWFFDLDRYERSREFAVKINAVTAGRFYLPQVTFEAMYDSAYYASYPGGEVYVRSRSDVD